MKKRMGFVSNSSSSSFVIKRADVSDAQIKMIRDYEKCGRLKKCKEEAERCEGCVPEMFEYNDYGWTIEVTDDEVRGRTLMDNFDMNAYLRDVVRVERFGYERD